MVEAGVQGEPCCVLGPPVGDGVASMSDLECTELGAVVHFGGFAAEAAYEYDPFGVQDAPGSTLAESVMVLLLV